MTEPKLLTEAEARAMCEDGFEAVLAELRERGLIAEEPVDPLLIEAREICAQSTECGQSKAAFRKGIWDEWSNVQVAVAALKRGMELVQGVHQLLGKTEELRGPTISKMETVAERPSLTREMVRTAWCNANSMHKSACVNEEFVDRLHAALTKEQS